VHQRMSALGQKRTLGRLRFKEAQIERREHQDYPDIQQDGCLSSHPSFLVRYWPKARAAELGHSGAWIAEKTCAMQNPILRWAILMGVPRGMR
jgi:hypothetical protein